MALGDMFLKLKSSRAGAVKGEASTPGHKDEIDITEWHWGMTGPRDMSGLGRKGRIALNELRVSKKVDSASAQLMSVMRSNDEITEGVLTVRKVGGDSKSIDYFTIKIKGGRITELDVGTEASGLPGLIEHMAIAFEEIEVTYLPQASTGGATGAISFNASVDKG